MIILQTAGNWRQECERILSEFFAQFTMRAQMVDTFPPGTEHDDPAVDVHSHSFVEGVVTMSVTGRLKDVEQKIHHLKGEANQVSLYFVTLNEWDFIMISMGLISKILVGYSCNKTRCA